MSGSSFGNLFKVTTWGESHGKALGVVIDGCPSNIKIDEEEIQKFLDRRKPGNSKYATTRKESDKIEILSGVFEGISTGTPISMIVYNDNQKSKDYTNISDIFRPGHADYTFYKKYNNRDYRGGGRSSGRETVSRVAAGAIAKNILKFLGIDVFAYTYSINDIIINKNNFDKNQIYENDLAMPDEIAFKKASLLIDDLIKKGDSVGGVIECIIKGIKAGIGEPVFEKLDANLAKAVFSIGAVKAFEIGSGIDSSKSTGSLNNDSFFSDKNNKINKLTNNSGGILGGISDGFDIILKAHVKPTPSIFTTQNTVNIKNENVSINIKGRHDPIIVPRAVVVVESMVAITLVDFIFQSFISNIDFVKKFYEDL